MLKDNKVEFNNGFITHYAQLKLDKVIRSPEQYEINIMAAFRTLCFKHNLSTIVLNRKLKTPELERFKNFLF
ncbi:MAG TPA: hypothetical protein VK991_04855, partial [Halomonas sp.]|nr:hypothetical protein [Halomonas sp.]